MHTHPDEAIRLEALDPRHSYIVQAPAGSGKTTLLTQRYLALLKTVQQPEAILALTFTKKAAAEMKQRVLVALTLAKAPLIESARSQERTIWTLARSVLEHAAKYQWHLLENPSRMQIQTLDAFAVSLARTRPILSEGISLANIDPHPEGLYETAAKNVIAYLNKPNHPWHDALIKILSHLDVNLSKMSDLFVNILSHREQWLPYLLDSDLSNHMHHALVELIQESLAPLKQLPKDLIERWQAVYHYTCDILKITPQPCGDQIKQQLPFWQALIACLLKKDGAFRKNFNSKQGFLAGSTLKHPEEKIYHKHFKDEAKTLIACLKQLPNCHKELQDILRLPNPKDLDNIKKLINALATVLPLLIIELQLIFKNKQYTDFNEMTLTATAALGDFESPSHVQLKLDHQIQHVLIDEFQDTAISQYRLLEKLISGWEANDGRTLFLVGDPMQSIYQFRQAEVGLFLNVQRKKNNPLCICPLYLSSNFRSSDTIVTWLNQNFKNIFPQQAIARYGAVPYMPAQATQALSGEIHVQLFHDSNEEIQALLAKIRSYQAQKKSIAILVRSRNHLKPLLPLLYKANIAFQGTELDYLKDHPLCTDLLSLAKALSIPSNPLDWFALLRSPFCGLSLKTLYYCAQLESDHFYRNLCTHYQNFPIAPKEKQRLCAFIQILDPIRDTLKARPLAQNLEIIFSQCLAKIDGFQSEQSQQVAEQFFELIENFEQGITIQDWRSFEKKLAKTRIKAFSKKNHSINIMTIHKAKGLEFDAVMLPFLNKRAGQHEAKIMEWFEFNNDAQKNFFLLAPIKGHASDTEPLSDYLKHISKMKARYELQRLFYVACSRAKSDLYLTGLIKFDNNDAPITPSANTCLDLIWDQIPLKLKQKSHSSTISLDRTSPKIKSSYSRIPLKHYETIAKQTIPRFETVPTAAFAEQPIALPNWQTRVGSLLHAIFSEYLQDPPELREIYLKQFAHKDGKLAFKQQLNSLQIPPHQADQITDDSIRAINNVCFSANKPWLSQEALQIATEYEIHYFDPDLQQEKLYYIDLIVANPTLLWVIDYKIIFQNTIDLNRIKRHYQTQLERYATAIRQFDRRQIQLALYLPIQDIWIEWSP